MILLGLRGYPGSLYQHLSSGCDYLEAALSHARRRILVDRTGTRILNMLLFWFSGGLKKMLKTFTTELVVTPRENYLSLRYVVFRSKVVMNCLSMSFAFSVDVFPMSLEASWTVETLSHR